jgi:hypothetical protein
MLIRWTIIVLALGPVVFAAITFEAVQGNAAFSPLQVRTSGGQVSVSVNTP